VTFGLIVRATETGLGYQTREIYRHLNPDLTVVIDMSQVPGHAQDRQHFDWYPDGIVTTWRGVRTPLINKSVVRQLAEMDTVMSVETWYDLAIPREARRSILYVNPELFGREPATQYWVPTSWLVDRLPPHTRVVPMPVNTDLPWEAGEGLLHVDGVGAAADRNGLEITLRAAKAAGVDVNVASQQADLNLAYGTRVEAADPVDLYRHGSVLIMPRRYGGLSLPVQEAMAAGLAVVMPDCAPNPQTWPVKTFGGKWGGKVALPGGLIRQYVPDWRDLASVLRDMGWVPEYQERSRIWAASHSWDLLGDTWRELLK